MVDEPSGWRHFWTRTLNGGGAHDGSDSATGRARAHRVMRGTLLLLGVVTVAGVIAAATYARRKEAPVGSLATLVLLAGAALVLGTLVGFLFGIPRTLQGQAADKSKRTYEVNTNLEQISDWLTKIIVGLTLVNLGSIPHQLMTMNDYFGPALGGGRSAEVLAGAAAVYFSVTGFFWGYLGTRLYLAGAIPWADDAGNISAVLDAARAVAEGAGRQEPVTPDSEPKPAQAPVELQRVVKAADATRVDPMTVAPGDARTLALSYYATGRFRDALPYFEAANTDPAADPQFTLHHAVALGESEQYRRAVSLLETLARQQKGVPNVYQLLGYYMLWLPDRLQDAVRYNQMYLNSIGSDDPAAFFNLACAHADLYDGLKKRADARAAAQHRDLAIADLKRAIRMNPRYRDRAIQLRNEGENFTALTDAEFEDALRTT